MTVDDDILTVARDRLAAEAAAVHSLAQALDATFVHAASMVLGCRGKLFIGGSGTSGTVARRMAHVLSVTGTPSIAFSPMDSLHGGSGAITGQDLALLISKGGDSDEVIQAAHLIQGRGAAVIALTHSHDTPLARAADHSVVVAVDPRADIGGLVATGVSLAQAAWGDALAEVLMRGRGYTWREFLTTHPAGAVGQRADLPSDAPALEIPAFTAAPEVVS